MKTNKLRLFRYAGTKHHAIEFINNLLENLDVKVYFEPFLGSGAVFLNLQKEFKKYFINDKDENVISVFQSFKTINYSDFENVYEKIYNDFGDIKNNKESYYSYRKFYNENYHFTNKTEKGLYLYFLMNSCINSMARFGKMGFNQGFGNRLYLIDQKAFNQIKKKLEKTELYNLDYSEFIFDRKDLFYFFDPPYVDSGSSYKSFSKNEQVFFIEKIKNLKSRIVYTEFESEYISKNLGVKWKNQIIKQLRNTSPLRKEEKTQNEVAYYNF